MSTDESGGEAETRTLVLGATVVGLLGIGWFVLSHVVMRTPTVDAVVEALGVMLALLVVASVIGAVRGAMRDKRRDGDASTPGST
jgi:hypothetical protein